MKLAMTLLALALVAAAPRASAQSTDVSITGRIFPGSCDIQLGSGGVADLGLINAAQLNAAVPTDLEPVMLTLAVACESPMRFALEGIDNRNESSAYTRMYGLGLTPESERIGGAELMLGNVTADAAPAYGTASSDSGASWDASSGASLSDLQPNQLRGFAKEQGVTTGPAATTSLQGNLYVGTRIQPLEAIRLTDEVSISGSVTLNVIYL